MKQVERRGQRETFKEVDFDHILVFESPSSERLSNVSLITFMSLVVNRNALGYKQKHENKQHSHTHRVQVHLEVSQLNTSIGCFADRLKSQNHTVQKLEI